MLQYNIAYIVYRLGGDRRPDVLGVLDKQHFLDRTPRHP